MHISQISIDGFGRLKNFSAPLENFTLVTGKNGTGKTMILNAIAIGLIGYVPELGNKSNLTKGRMSGRMGTIDLKMGTQGISIMFPAAGNPVERRTGELPKLDPMVLDIGRFFAMTGPQRVKFLLGLSSVDIPQARSVMTILYEDTFQKHKMTRTEWDPIVGPVFSKFTEKPMESLDWLSQLKDEAAKAKQDVAGVTSLRDTALRLEKELQPTGEAPITDQAPKIREHKVKVEAARKAHLDASKLASNHRGKISSLQTDSAKMLRDSLDKPDSKCPTCGAAVRGAKKEENVKASLQEGARRKSEEVTQLEQLLPGLDADVSRLKGELDMLLMQQEGMESVQRKYTMLVGGQLQLDKIRLDIQLLEEKEGILRSLPNWISKFQADLLEKSLGPVCSIASSIVKERFGMTVGIQDGDFVLIQDGLAIGLDYVSGGQRLLATIGIQVALMQKAPFKLVMVDELGRVDEPAMVAMSHMVADLIRRGLIDQFIGTRPEISGETAAVIHSSIGDTPSTTIKL